MMTYRPEKALRVLTRTYFNSADLTIGLSFLTHGVGTGGPRLMYNTVILKKYPPAQRCTYVRDIGGVV